MKRIEEREFEAGVYLMHSCANPLMAPGVYRGYAGFSALVVSDAVEDFTSSSIVSPDLAQQRVRSDSLS